MIVVSSVTEAKASLSSLIEKVIAGQEVIIYPGLFCGHCRHCIAGEQSQCEQFGLVGLGWERYVRIDEKYLRPTEVEELCGNPAKARERLGWEARTTFRDLVHLMLEHDLADAGVEAGAVTGA